jgi:hypothetical protein
LTLTNGINAYIKHIDKKLPIEFQILGFTPKLWQPEDILGRMSGSAISTRDILELLQGEPASAPVVVNDRSYPIRVRFPAETRSSLEAIKNTMLVSGTGKTATIGSMARIVEIPGQREIRRENLQRDVTVTARFENMNLGDGMAKIQKAIDDLKLPPGIRVQYGGQYEEQQKSFKDLAFVLVLAIVLVFTVLLFEFGNFAAPIAVISSALLSTCGVFLALLVTGTTFNLSSFMGMIMVIGIVAKNGILLLDADQKFRDLGFSAEDAILQASRRRLRPIVMTALATLAGMLPLSFAIGAGSQMLQPLAIAVIGGVVISMVLSLIITPAVHFFAPPPPPLGCRSRMVRMRLFDSSATLIMAITGRGIKPHSARGLARVSPDDTFSAERRMAADNTRLPVESLLISNDFKSGTPLRNNAANCCESGCGASGRSVMRLGYVCLT